MPAPSRTRSPASHRHQESDATDASTFGNVKPSIPLPSQSPMPAPSRMQSPAPYCLRESEATDLQEHEAQHPNAFSIADASTFENTRPSIPTPSQFPRPAPLRTRSPASQYLSIADASTFKNVKFPSAFSIADASTFENAKPNIPMLSRFPMPAPLRT